ncbi:MAG: ribosome maturation factor RimP [Firmicutes bacterium]|nr:ribosome maturation factor RimP [Bacillota bacterium]
MDKNKVESITKDIAIPISEDMNLDLVDVEYVKEGSHMYLRVYIDKPGGISIEDCQNISQKISEKLDKIDPIKENYFLEVSSPGLDRPLKTDEDLNKNIGKDIEVSLYKSINGKKKYIGNLLDISKEEIEIEDEDLGKCKLNRKIIAKINLAVKF